MKQRETGSGRGFDSHHLHQKEIVMNLNRPNEYGVPLHACNGYRQDEHRWAYLQFLIDGGAMVSTGQRVTEWTTHQSRC